MINNIFLFMFQKIFIVKQRIEQETIFVLNIVLLFLLKKKEKSYFYACTPNAILLCFLFKKKYVFKIQVP